MIAIPGDMFKEEFAWVDVAQVLLAALALGQLLQQVFVHVPDQGHHDNTSQTCLNSSVKHV